MKQLIWVCDAGGGVVGAAARGIAGEYDCNINQGDLGPVHGSSWDCGRCFCEECTEVGPDFHNTRVAPTACSDGRRALTRGERAQQKLSELMEHHDKVVTANRNRGMNLAVGPQTRRERLLEWRPRGRKVA